MFDRLCQIKRKAVQGNTTFATSFFTVGIFFIFSIVAFFESVSLGSFAWITITGFSAVAGLLGLYSILEEYVRGFDE